MPTKQKNDVRVSYGSNTQIMNVKMNGLSNLSRSLCDKMENASDKTRQLMQEVNDFKKSILSQDS
jgi:hypothetical protein